MSNKKAKLQEDDLDSSFEKVKQYLLDCPFVETQHPAIQAALEGINRELSRRHRDAKLQKAFLQDSVTVEKQDATEEGDIMMSLEAEAVTTSDTGGSQKTVSLNMPKEEADADDWHDVREDEHDHDPHEEEEGFLLGASLAKEVIAQIALFKVHVTSPLQAVAVALHAALRGCLGFACTGVPEKTVSGFAPPIRELPKTQFLPKHWENRDETPACISLRYRKNATGPIVMRVEESGVDASSSASSSVVWVKVSILPTAASSEEPLPNDALVFPVSDYVNLPSFQLALQESCHNGNSKTGGGVAPALHYKSLSTLMRKFVGTFDLAVDSDEKGSTTTQGSSSLPYVDTTIRSLPVYSNSHNNNNAHSNIMDRQLPGIPPSLRPQAPPRDDDGMSPTIDSAFPGLSRPQHQHPRGDFADDLIPGGGIHPGFGTDSPFMGGNLMGPNHPHFSGFPDGGGGPARPGGGIAGVGPSSGFGMRPRFDPYGPPGGPTDPDNNDINNPHNANRGRRPGGTGDPNPDHLRPPNNLSSHDNMFL